MEDDNLPQYPLPRASTHYGVSDVRDVALGWRLACVFLWARRSNHCDHMRHAVARLLCPMPTKLNTDVDLPFRPYFRKTMRSGQKQVTSRTRRMAEPGQTFPAFDYHYQIISVEQRPLWFVKWALWWYEGCQSPRAFQATWCQIHQKAGWTPAKPVWVHHFGRLQL